MTLRDSTIYLVTAHMGLVVALSGAMCTSTIDPGQIDPNWGGAIDAALDAALKRRQEIQQVPPEPCMGATLDEGLPCPHTDPSHLDPVTFLHLFNNSVDVDTKWGKGKVIYTHTVTLNSTCNESQLHTHQCISEDPATCATRYVRWRMVLDFASTIKARCTIGTILVDLDVQLGTLGKRTGQTYCRFVNHPDPRNCGPEEGQGACCIPGSQCQVTTQANCASLGGTYRGDGTNCSMCGTVPTVSQWGLIVLTLLLLTTGTLVIARQRRRPVAT